MRTGIVEEGEEEESSKLFVFEGIFLYCSRCLFCLVLCCGLESLKLRLSMCECVCFGCCLLCLLRWFVDVFVEAWGAFILFVTEHPPDPSRSTTCAFAKNSFLAFSVLVISAPLNAIRLPYKEIKRPRPLSFAPPPLFTKGEFLPFE